MKYYQFIFGVCTLITLLSCGTGMRISDKKLKGISTNFEGFFENKPFKKTDKSKISGHHFLLKQFNIPDTIVGMVNLKFISEKKLEVQYKGSLGLLRETFEGEFHKKGYFEVYLHKEKIEIPPLIPILYSRVNVDRLRINLTKEGNLIIDNYYDRGGNLLIFAGGVSNRNQFYFKKL